MKKHGTREVLGGRGERLRRAVPVDVAADEERRALAPTATIAASRLDGVVVDRLVPQPGAVGDVAVGRSEDVEREVEEDRSAMAAGRRAARHRGRPRRPSTGSVTVAASLVIGASDRHVVELLQRAGAPARRCGARPPRTTSGDPLNIADVTAEMPLVTPGPAVSAATPGRRVSLA